MVEQRIDGRDHDHERKQHGHCLYALHAVEQAVVDQRTDPGCQDVQRVHDHRPEEDGSEKEHDAHRGMTAGKAVVLRALHPVYPPISVPRPTQVYSQVTASPSCST